MNSLLMRLIRWFLVFTAAVLIQRGIISADSSDVLVQYGETIIGAVMAVASLLWMNREWLLSTLALNTARVAPAATPERVIKTAVVQQYRQLGWWRSLLAVFRDPCVHAEVPTELDADAPEAPTSRADYALQVALETRDRLEDVYGLLKPKRKRGTRRTGVTDPADSADDPAASVPPATEPLVVVEEPVSPPTRSRRTRRQS